MRSQHFRKIVAQTEVVVDLIELFRDGPNRKTIEDNAFDALRLGRPWNDSRKALRGKADPQPASRLAQIVFIARIIDVKFIHDTRSKRFGIAYVDQLCAARVQTVEPGHAGSVLAGRVRIVLGIIVKKIVAEYRAPARVGIDALTNLIVVQNLIERRRRKVVSETRRGRGDIFQQCQGGSGPRTLRDYGTRENARSGGASREIVGFTPGNRVPELLRQLGRDRSVGSRARE